MSEEEEEELHLTHKHKWEKFGAAWYHDFVKLQKWICRECRSSRVREDRWGKPDA